MTFSLSLFYFLLLLLPTQIGRHFFFPFSLVAGIRSDYLTPTLYLTDIISFLLISFCFVDTCKSLRQRRISLWPKKLKINFCFLFFVFCFLLFNVFFVAANKEAAFYFFIKLIEYIFLGMSIQRLQPKTLSLCTMFALSVLYVSGIAIGQFILQRSIGGIFWFLGERTFYATTPGIAAISLWGRLLLRPYATFPHPNVLGGFLAVILPFIFSWFLTHKKETPKILQGVFIISLVMGVITLFLSFSRGAWCVFFLGLFLIIKKTKPGAFALVLFYVFLLLSIITPLGITIQTESVIERKNLLQISIQSIASQPLFGVGLNNFVVRLSRQPVHHIYMLILTETGLFGFTLFLLFLALLFRRILKAHFMISIALIQLLFLGFFDHYLFTLQQGQLLVTLFVSLAFLDKNS